MMPMLLTMAALAIALGTATPASPPATPAATAGESLYLLSSAWHDQDGRATTLASLRGRPVALAMIYASCRAACPLTIADMKAIEHAVGAAALAHTRFVLVSFDPTRDTPAVLKKLAADHALDPARWTLLTGDDDGVRELAAVLGVQYRLAGSEFVHSSVITILDADGVIRSQQLGVQQDPAASAALLRELAAHPGAH